MTDRAALLRAILEDPADDAPRLVYADWLDEHGDIARAEFIRLQCTLARPDAPEPECDYPFPNLRAIGKFTKRCRCPCCRLRRREWTIWRHHGCDWQGEYLRPIVEEDVRESLATGRPLRDGRNWLDPATRCEFARGLIATICLPAAAFFEHAAALFAAHPITSVRLTDREPGQFGNTRRWYWTMQTTDTTYPKHTLPPDLMALVGGRPVHGPVCGDERFTRDWDTDTEAVAAMSSACIAFGREAAGLPPLPGPVGSAT
jgi:uncharacterized protein (TIGR02996 family)